MATSKVGVTEGAGKNIATHSITTEDSITKDIQRVELNDSTGAEILGLLTASPAANTLGDRLKALLTGVVLAVGGNIIGKVGIDQTTPGVTNRVSNANGYAQTYIASGSGYTAYATPQDMLCIRGSATKTVVVQQMGLKVNSTAAALMNFQWIKRSAADTGGASTNPAAIKFNSADPAATAQIDLYTALPALGAAAGTLAYQNVLSTVPTAVPGSVLLTNAISPLATFLSIPALGEPITLNGVAESLCLNFNGAALPAGFTAYWEACWVEF